jgi:hypothetical protein
MTRVDIGPDGLAYVVSSGASQCDRLNIGVLSASDVGGIGDVMPSYAL